MNIKNDINDNNKSVTSSYKVIGNEAICNFINNKKPILPGIFIQFPVKFYK